MKYPVLSSLLLTSTGLLASLMIVSPEAMGQVSETAARAPARVVSTEAAGTVEPEASDKAAEGAATVKEIMLHREVFSYSSGGRRDPYRSLMSSSELRPLLSDLRLTAVAFDPVGSNSVAILRDGNSKVQYRIRVGQQIGRLRVTAIRQKSVQFTVEEFGFSRQETLQLSSDTTKVRNP